MLIPILVTLFLQFQRLNCQAVDSNGISLYDKLEEMERLLLAQNGLETSVNPCSFFQTGDPHRGQQTSAEWVRIVFHDAITADISAGTGGLDASISFESDREENIGIAFVNDTIGIFSNFFSAYTSMADIIALGLADSLISCDPNPRLIKLRVGRKDALGPGPTGVPGPADDLTSTFATFAKAGFSQSETIGLVACGHSMGSVNHVDFPDIVDPSVINENNLDGTDSFDSTKDVFDNTGVNEYLDGTGKRGGPLVVGHNVTTRSDLRIFSSDGNATMRALSSAKAFQDTCYTLFEKMLNTVPSGVTLSDIIVPRTWTMLESGLDLSPAGVVSFAGKITSNFKTTTPPTTASYFYTTTGGGNTGAKNSNPGVSFPKRGYGTITNYAFNSTLNNAGITGISVMSSYTAPINQKLFVLVRQSFRKAGSSPSGGQQVIVRAALLSTLSPAGTTLTTTLYYPTRQEGTLAPKLAKATASMSSFKTVGAYKVFQGVINLTPGNPFNGNPVIDVKLGATLTSAKVSAQLWPFCTNDIITTC